MFERFDFFFIVKSSSFGLFKLLTCFVWNTGKTISLDPKTSIVVPQERAGLLAIDVLDPDLVMLFNL